MAKRMLLASVLVAWVLLFGWLYLDEAYTAFLAPRFAYLIAGGALLTAAFLFATIWPLVRRPGTLRRRDLVSWLILALPVLYIAESHDATLGDYAFRRRIVGPVAGSYTALQGAIPQSSADELPQGQRKKIPLGRLPRYFKHYEGKRIATAGMVLTGTQLPPGHFVAFQFDINCCAADAIPVAVLVNWRYAHEFKRNQWVEIHGRLGRVRAMGTVVPFIAASLVRTIERPKNPYSSR